MVTPLDEDDIDRLAEAVWRDSRGRIVDRDTFDLAFGKYLGGTFTPKQQREIFPKVFERLREDQPGRISRKREFREGGGKSLSRDQLKTAERLATSRAEYERLGADKSDYPGLDTAPTRDMSYVGRVRGRVVHTSKETRKGRKGNLVTRYRDRRGRYATPPRGS